MRWGLVTSRRALDAALVLDNPATREAHSLYERDPMPACSHVAQPVCPQVPCDVHTNTTTSILGLAQLFNSGSQGAEYEGERLQRHGLRASRNARARRAVMSAAGHPRCNERRSVSFSACFASMLPLPCHACHATPHIAAPMLRCRGRALLMRPVQDAPRSQRPPGPPARLHLRFV